MPRLLKVALTTALLTCLGMGLLILQQHLRNPAPTGLFDEVMPRLKVPVQLRRTGTTLPGLDGISGADTTHPPRKLAPLRPFAPTNGLARITSTSPPPLPPPLPAEMRQGEWKAAVEARNAPIAFWGVVVDQDGQPISGVRVVLSIRHWKFTLPFNISSVHPQREVLSDWGGRFQIEGESGDVLELVRVEKEGYLLSPTAARAFPYGASSEPFTPDSNNPVVIRMWRSGASEPTLKREGFWALTPDGRPYTLDLLTNDKRENENEGGDIVMKLVRPLNVNSADRYPWGLEIASREGGLVEAKDEFLYRAPEGGYSPTVTVEMNPTNTTWTSVLKRAFYITSRRGQVYGAIQMTIRPNYAKSGAIQMKWVLNTSGSRNLQP